MVSFAPRRPWAAALSALAALAFALVAAQPAAAESQSILGPGQTLRSGAELSAGSARLSMRADGDLALYYVPLRAHSPLARRAKPPVPGCHSRRCRFLRPRLLWHSGTAGHRGAQLRMGADGAASVLAHGKVLWSSGTRQRGASLRLGPDGNLGVYAPPRARASEAARAASLQQELEELWATGTETPGYVGSELASGQTLAAGQYLQSANGQYELDMTPQGWLALWVRGAGPCPMFLAPTGGNSPYLAKQPGSCLNMEADGSLSIRSPQPGNEEIWWMLNYNNPHEREQPTPVPGSRMVLEEDGNLAVIAPGGSVVWQTETDLIRGSVLCPGESLFYGQILGSVYSGPGSQYQADYYLQVATANRGRGSEVNIAGAGRLTTTHIYKNKTGPSATGMYLQMQDWGGLQLLLDGGDGTPIWENGTAFPNSFAWVNHIGSLQIYAPMRDAEGKRVFEPIYEQPNSEEELSKGISGSEKLSMSLAPMG